MDITGHKRKANENFMFHSCTISEFIHSVVIAQQGDTAEKQNKFTIDFH